MHRLILRPGRDKSLRRNHPWIYSGAVARIDGDPGSGDTVEVCSSAGEFLAMAAFSPMSQIRARVWDREKRAIDAALIRDRIVRAVQARAALIEGRTSDSMRLVHGESDGLPGLVADRYADTVVVQLLSAGAERWRTAITDALVAVPGVVRIWERSDAEVRQLEGLRPRTGLLHGSPPAGALTIHEHGLAYSIELLTGQKSGFYLDQRDNRMQSRMLARNCDVLDCFSYTGGFALNAAAAGARSVTAVESSGLALDQGRINAAANGFASIDWVEGDVFQVLRHYRDQGRRFDLIVLDPPKFAPTAGHAARAARAYKDINLLAFKLLRPQGALMSFSCSGGISAELFQKIVAGAALDADVDARIERWLHAPPDHPVALNFPESEYLKGLMCRVG